MYIHNTYIIMVVHVLCIDLYKYHLLWLASLVSYIDPSLFPRVQEEGRV